MGCESHRVYKQNRKRPPKREQRKMAKSRHGDGQLASHKPHPGWQEIRQRSSSSSTRRVRDGGVTAVVTPNLWASLCILFGLPSFSGSMPGPRRDARPFRPRAQLCNSPLTPSTLALPPSSPPTQDLSCVRPSILLARYGRQIQPRQQSITVA